MHSSRVSNPEPGAGVRPRSRYGRVTGLASALTVLLAMVPCAAPAQTTTSPQSGGAAGQAGNPQEPVAMIAGQPVTAEEITSFGVLLSSMERRPDDNPAIDLEDYILTRLHGDVYTTVPVSDPELAGVPTKYKHAAQRSLLQREFRQSVEQGVEVTRPEMEKWYAENVEQFVQPESISAHHLFMEISAEEPTSAPDRVRQRMEQVKREADAGTSFAMLAKRYSEASSGATGGAIGTVRRGRPFGPQGKPINPRLEEALFRLQPGEVSDIVQTSHGLHLLYAADRTTTMTPTLEDFITSGIVQRALRNDKVTSQRRELLARSIRTHNGRIADPGTTSTEELTTATPAIEFAGKTFTVHDVEKMYGLPFTRAFARAKSNPADLRELYGQVLDLEAEVQAAIDAGVDKRPDIARSLALLGERADALRHLQAVFAGAAPVTEERQRAEYEKIKDTLRRPEAEGWVITLKSATGTEAADPAAAGRAQEQLERQAQEVRKRLDAGEDFEKVAREVSRDDLASSGGVVSRHVLNAGGPSEAIRAFDMAATHAEKEGDIVGPIVVGENRVIGKLGKRYPGEPVPFEMIQQRLARQLQSENQNQMRQEILRQLEASGKVRYLPGAARYGKQPTPAAAANQ